jgi:leucine dehydrogenase
MDFEQLLARWDGEHAVIRHDEESGAWMFVGVHSTVLGPAVGGTRMRVYPTPADGLADVLRLSGAMTQKLAGTGMARGGGKAVLAVPELPTGDARRRLLRRYGELVASLGGTYRTAGDMNISPADLEIVAETCPWVYGTAANGGDSGPGTARGIFHAIRTTVDKAFGSPDLAGRSVLIQGVGAVGGLLARELADAGARVLVSDADEARAAATGFEVVAPELAIGTEVDVFAPCAVGAVLNAESIPRLACRAVAGAANNQLAEPADADLLHERGILYAPDYVVNSGGVIQLVGVADEGWGAEQLETALAGIGDTLRALFREAEEKGITPAEAADRLVRRRLAEHEVRET